ncbi:MAG: PQQ-dependent sugar dehydrogenase [Acidimicrobiales bacterium]|nr:PQQ-dependent sugar dehydrogenase [Acidimicrobiales bacterium]
MPRLLIALAATTLLAGCSLLDRPPPPKETTVVVPDAADAASIGPRSDGSFLYGERLTGRIVAVGADGQVDPNPVATVGVSAGQASGGLLGVAVDDAGRVFALATRPDARVAVLQVAPDGERVVWEGPEVTGADLGGGLLVRNGRIVFVIGDLGDPAAVADASAPNGKLLSVLPDGPATQRPTVLGAGFVDPVGVVVGPFDDWWVADRAGSTAADGDVPARLVRVRPGGELEPTSIEDGAIVPAALVSLGPDDLGLCDAASGAVRSVGIVDGYAAQPGDVVAEGCTLAAARAGATVLISGAGADGAPGEIRSFPV